MPILSQDIKLLESDTMTDAAEGGGAVTGKVIIDGESNNIYDDISTLNRVFGAVHMRKVFGAIITQTVNKYFGSHIIISRLPVDKKLGISLFKTADWFDRRTSAQNRVENYLAQGGGYGGWLLGTQHKGSRVITIFQLESLGLPGIGDVLILLSNSAEQYVRIIRLEDEVREFVDDNGIYKRRVLSIEISDILENDFVGAAVNRTTPNPNTDIFETVVANAAKYYSARPLAIAASNGDFIVKTDTIYSQVVPSAQSETAIIDGTAGGLSLPIIESSQANVIFTVSNLLSANISLHIGSAVLPGSLSINVPGDILTDSGGQIKNTGGTIVATITYVDGLVTFVSDSPSYSGTKTVTFRPAAAPNKLADTVSLPVTAANRGYVWTLNINPAPMPGSLKVAYRAIDKWYELNDNGGGGLVAVDSVIGSGTVSYISGSVSITLGALPDANSEIIFSWSSRSSFVNRSDLTPPPLTIEHNLNNTGADASTVVVTWNDGLARSASANINGDFSGDATGTVQVGTGKIELIPNVLPAQNTLFAFNYSAGVLVESNIDTFGLSGTVATVDLGSTNLIPGSITISWSAFYNRPPEGFYINPVTFQDEIVKDDGSGNLLSITTGNSVGTIDYATGIATFETSFSFAEPYYEPIIVNLGSFTPRRFPSDVLSHQSISTLAPSSFTVKIKTAADSVQPEETLTLSNLNFDLTPGFGEIIVGGSVMFTLAGKTHIDRQGQLYFDIDPSTGAGTYAGTLDQSTGKINLSVWGSGGENLLDLKSLLTDLSYQPVDQVVFRVAVAPVKTQSFSIRCVPSDGGSQISATSNADGSISTADMDGHIDFETGVVNIRFGAWVTATGNEGEWWYSAIAVIGGLIFKPRHVFADTIFYNAVSITFLPLSAEILGLNPVRLPSDGRVPIYATGDVVVILHDQATTGTFSNLEVTDLGRGRIAKLSVRDAGNNLISATTYSADLDTGIITWGDLAGISQPLTITDRIEDMAVITDVQITGDLTLSQPLTHDFPVNETLVSNAVIYGDLYAHTTIPFDQQTWTNKWSDSRIGTNVVAQYNNSQFPIDINNASTINERWVIIFTNSSNFTVTGENVGQIATGSTSTDTAPINPNTNDPYFTIPSGGWGAGWSSGNVLRFNTLAANVPIWIIQAISQGDATSDDFTFCLEFRGDIDTL